MYPSCSLFVNLIKNSSIDLKIVCLENPNSSGYLVWLPQQVSSAIGQTFQGILNDTSSQAYMNPHDIHMLFWSRSHQDFGVDLPWKP